MTGLNITLMPRDKRVLSVMIDHGGLIDRELLPELLRRNGKEVVKPASIKTQLRRWANAGWVRSVRMTREEHSRHHIMLLPEAYAALELKEPAECRWNRRLILRAEELLREIHDSYQQQLLHPGERVEDC